MPDLAAGTTILAQDTPPTVESTQNDSYTFTNTTYGVASTGGSYAEVGTPFMAPTTGRVKVTTVAHVEGNSGTSIGLVSPVVREGGTVGSGTTFVGASDQIAVYSQDVEDRRSSVVMLVTGLTPGATYNVRLEHRVSSGTGTALRRTVIVEPAT